MPAHYISDEYAVCGSQALLNVDNTTAASEYIDMSKFQKVVFIGVVKDASADTTVNAKIQSADDGSGTNVADITNLAITQFTAAATEKEFVIEVRQNQLNVNDTHVRLLITAGNGTVGISGGVIAIGYPDALPASEYDLATVQEIKHL